VGQGDGERDVERDEGPGPTRAFVAGGSNVDPERHIALAARLLLAAFPGTRFSNCYRNRAVGFEGPDFLNFVAEIPTRLEVDELLAELHRIEAACGRARDAPKWAPRSMDLDVLLYGQRVEARAELTLPRPDLLSKPYMLGPMAELAPGVRHPQLGTTMGELWAAFDRAAHALEACPGLLPPLPADATAAVHG
jgi:2-amino-4-hydroxy-6-hydroxymethyldihydropteridine diphosphokinase